MSLDKLSFFETMVIEKNHPALAGHFPGNPIVPGVVILDQVMRLWQEKSKQSIAQINNTKFVSLLRPGVICTIEYIEKPNNKIDFAITDEDKKVIAKGLFSYAK